jgi:hypothetical protein
VKVPHRGFFFYDPGVKHLVIVPPKCGSTSFTNYFTNFRVYEGRQAGDTWEYASIVVRHPYERVVSALNFLKLPLTTESALENRRNQHLIPYVEWIAGREPVQPLRLEQIPLFYPDFPQLNKGPEADWADTAIDWDQLYPIYKQDFELCPKNWSH